MQRQTHGVYTPPFPWPDDAPPYPVVPPAPAPPALPAPEDTEAEAAKQMRDLLEVISKGLEVV